MEYSYCSLADFSCVLTVECGSRRISCPRDLIPPLMFLRLRFVSVDACAYDDFV